MIGPPKIETVDRDHVLAVWDNIFIQVWRDSPIEERTRAMRGTGRRFLQSVTGDVGVVVVIEEKCPVPDSKARTHTVEFLNDLRERGKGIALVFEGDGFRAAATRATMVGLIMAARFPIPYRVVRNVAEAAIFLHPVLAEVGKDEEAMIRAVGWTRSRMPHEPTLAR